MFNPQPTNAGDVKYEFTTTELNVAALPVILY